jgi:hypothetical protein
MWTEYLITICAIAVLTMLYRRDRKKTRYQRAVFFAPVLEMFQSYRVVQEGTSYPILRGIYKGFDVKLEPIVDTMCWRKLPTLLLDVTLIAPTGFPAALDYLMRPNGNETYSHISELEFSLALPPNWPQEASLRSNDPVKIGASELDVLTTVAQNFFEPSWKEMVITPHGIRFVRLIAHCSRPHYVAFRELKFTDQLTPDVVRNTLDAAVRLIEQLPCCKPQLKVA